MVVIVEGHRHAVVGEHQEGQRARADFALWHQMRDKGLEEGLVRDPGRREEPRHVAAPGGEVQHRLDRAAAQAPPLAADAHRQVLGHLARQAEAPLQLQRAVEQSLALALVEPVPVDQPFFLDPGLDPVRAVEVEAFDMVHVLAVEAPPDVFRRLDRHAVAREHVEMRGPRKGRHCGLQPLQRRRHQAPFAPAAADAPPREGDLRVRRQHLADAGEVGHAGARVEMDRHAIPRRRQPQGLRDDPLRVLVAKQDEGDLRHSVLVWRSRVGRASLDRAIRP